MSARSFAIQGLLCDFRQAPRPLWVSVALSLPIGGWALYSGGPAP